MKLVYKFFIDRGAGQRIWVWFSLKRGSQKFDYKKGFLELLVIKKVGEGQKATTYREFITKITIY